MSVATVNTLASQNNSIQLSQAKLNIENKLRTNRLPWRGQFSPDLVAYLMDIVCKDAGIFLDPFCGSGTVLYEATLKGKQAYGIEINPAAWHLSSLVSFTQLEEIDKSEVILQLKQLISVVSDKRNELNFFKFKWDEFYMLLNLDNASTFLKKAIATSFLLGMGNEKTINSISLIKGAIAVLNLLKELYSLRGRAECILSDARDIPLPTESIDAVITSPPYINVFNYHQNYRTAVELLGWKPLESALSEIGANRKHRANRFLTVIQYCIDIAQCLDEIARVTKQKGHIVLVLGRTSTVLGVTFENSTLVKDVISCSNNFKVTHVAERFFTNRFGKKIYEDIIIAQRTSYQKTNLEKARTIGLTALKHIDSSVNSNNRSYLEEAINKSTSISPSRLLNLSLPPIFTL